MLRLSALSFLLPLMFQSSFGQKKSPFEWKKTMDISLSATSFLSAGSGYFFKNRIEPLTVSQVEQLNSKNVFWLDQPVVSYRSSAAAHVSDVGQYVSLALPLSVFAFQPSKKDLVIQCVMLQQVIGITYGFTTLSKAAVQRTSPFAYNPAVSMDEKLDAEVRTSFFSGHTAITSAMSFYTAAVVAAYSDNAVLKTVAWAGAATLPAVVGYSRVRAGEHFYSDVLVAYLVGGSIGWLVPHVHKKNNKDASGTVRWHPVITPQSSGVLITFKW